MIIVIHGAPASGKTTLASALRERYAIPVLSTDAIAESLYDSLGVHDPEKTRIRGAAYELLFYLITEFSISDGGFIVEGTFNPIGGPKRMKAALQKSRHTVIEIFMTAPDEVLLRRYTSRIETKSRHTAHNDKARAQKLKTHLQRTKYKPMAIGNAVFTIDTEKNFDKILAAAVEGIERTVRGNGL